MNAAIARVFIGHPFRGFSKTSLKLAGCSRWAKTRCLSTSCLGEMLQDAHAIADRHGVIEIILRLRRGGIVAAIDDLKIMPT